MAAKKTITVEQFAQRQPPARDPDQDADWARSRQTASHAHARRHSFCARHDQQDPASRPHRRRAGRPRYAKEHGSMRLNEIKDKPARARSASASAAASAPASARQGGRGGKGQTARTGVAIGGFEGGQMPLASPPAQARLQQVRPQGLQRDQPRRAAAGDRRQAARCRQAGRRSALWSPPASCAARRTACACSARGEIKAKLSLDRRPCFGHGQGGYREGRRLHQADREEDACGRRGQAQEDGGEEGVQPRSRRRQDRGIALARESRRSGRSAAAVGGVAAHRVGLPI